MLKTVLRKGAVLFIMPMLMVIFAVGWACWALVWCEDNYLHKKRRGATQNGEKVTA